MIPYKQSKVSSEDGTIHGSCFRTAIGSICEVDPETMPHWEDMGENWFSSFYHWLHEHGYEYYGVTSVCEFLSRADNDEEKAYELFMNELKNYQGIDGYVYVGGKSPRTFVTRGHAVVFKNGEMIHDPHPLNQGVTKVEYFFMIEKKK